MEEKKLKHFIAHVEIPEVAEEEHEIECWTLTEAIHLAKDYAFELYFKHEGSSYDLPSYDDLEERYHAEWFDLIDSEFERALDDMYIRIIQNAVRYWVDEVI